MKRAPSLEVLARLGHGDVLRDDIADIDPVLDSIDDLVRNQTSAHESRSSYLPVSPDWTDHLLSCRNN